MPPGHDNDGDAAASKAMALDLIVRREIDVSPLLSHTFTMDEIEKAMDYATTYKENARKVCIKF